MKTQFVFNTGLALLIAITILCVNSDYRKIRQLEHKQEAIKVELDRLETGQKMIWLQSHIDYTITNDGGRLILVLPSKNMGAIGNHITNTRPNTIMVELPENKTPVPE